MVHSFAEAELKIYSIKALVWTRVNRSGDVNKSISLSTTDRVVVVDQGIMAHAHATLCGCGRFLCRHITHTCQDDE